MFDVVRDLFQGNHLRKEMVLYTHPALTCDSMGRVFLSRSRSARQLSGSQSVAGAHV